MIHHKLLRNVYHPEIWVIHTTVGYNQLYDYLILCGLLCSQQSRFRKNHSTMTAIVDVTDHIYDNMDNSLLIGIVFLKSTFDTVNTEVLLRKIKLIGVRNSELAWFTNCMTGHQQPVNHVCVTSDCMSICYGVP